MLVKGCLQRGHSAFTFDHCFRHTKQKECAQLLVKDLLLKGPKHMEQLSGDSRREASPDAPSSLGSDDSVEAEGWPRLGLLPWEKAL